MIKNNDLNHLKEDLVDRVRQEDAYFRSIIENNSFYIIRTDLEGRYTYMNPFFCKMLSLKAEEWLGKESLSLILPDDHVACIDAVGKCFANPEVSIWVVLRKPVPDGLLYTQWEFKLLKDDSGNPYEILCIGHDITPLLLKQGELQNLVDVTAEQNKRLTNFTYIISHNIRSHVANIIGIVDISEDLENDKLALGMIRDSSERLDKTIRNLNEIISIQGSTSLPLEEINIFKEIRRVIESIKMLVDTADTRITYGLGDDEFLWTNPVYFESILLNLITNALKYKSPKRPLEINLDIFDDAEYKIISFRACLGF